MMFLFNLLKDTDTGGDYLLDLARAALPVFVCVLTGVANVLGWRGLKERSVRFILQLGMKEETQDVFNRGSFAH